jgi:hypothetical protein
LEITVFQTIAMLDRDFTQKTLDDGRGLVDIDAFPAVKAIGFAVWDKFYSDRARRPSPSDAFDLIIASAAPYMDAVITEKNLAEGLSQAKKRDDSIRDLRVFSIGEFRHGPPD